MELREYMSVRRAYNLVRQSMASGRRLTFEEFSILCKLDIADEPIKTSNIAEYQGALRPTMTHRTNHLARLGLIDRGEGTTDHRNIVCAISEEGKAYVQELARRTCDSIPAGQPLARTSAERILKYVDSMGSVYCTAGDLVLLGLLEEAEGGCTIMRLVEILGLLQPTVSMSVSSLADAGLVVRGSVGEGAPRTASISLTDRGRDSAHRLQERIAQIVVHRKPRRSQAG